MIRHAALAIALVLSPSWAYSQSTVVFTVTTASASVHKTPSTGSPVVGKAQRGAMFEVARELGSWVKIAWPDAQDGVGYLHVTWGAIARGGVEPGRAAAAAQATTQAAPVAAAVVAVEQHMTSAQPPGPRPTVVVLPDHRIGLGGRLSSSAFGFAVAGRAWSRGPLGLQVEFARSTLTSTSAPEHLTSIQFAPSLIYSLPDAVTNAAWIRPYIGAGGNLYRSTLSSLTPGVTDSTSDAGFGVQTFGGGEVTFAAVPQLGVSADLRYQWSPTPFTGYELGGLGLSLSAHWYVK